MSLPSRPRVVVTGAGSGLGRAFCIELARSGARLLVSDLSLRDAQATVDGLVGAEARAVACDVTQLPSVEALAAKAWEAFGGVDLWINNAGVAVAGRVGEISVEDWQWQLAVNLWGVIYGCHVVVPRLRQQGSGHVLNVASAAGLVSAPMMAPYNVSKAAVVALTETLYGELREEKIGATVLCPTFFKTNLSHTMRGDERAHRLADALMDSGKLSAEDVARKALAGVADGELYVVPQADGRWIWRMKRLMPAGFQRLVPSAFAAQAKRFGIDLS